MIVNKSFFFQIDSRAERSEQPSTRNRLHALLLSQQWGQWVSEGEGSFTRRGQCLFRCVQKIYSILYWHTIDRKPRRHSYSCSVLWRSLAAIRLTRDYASATATCASGRATDRPATVTQSIPALSLETRCQVAQLQIANTEQ